MPKHYESAHRLCFIVHDLLVEALRAGEEHEIFFDSIEVSDPTERELLETSTDIFEWFSATGRSSDQQRILFKSALPALVSDALNCFFYTLRASEKARLNISYMLVRKPIQETLFVLESLVLGIEQFGEKLANEPLQLRADKAGGAVAHTKRIQKVLEVIGLEDTFNAEYISNLRYNKKSSDNFDGACNQAMHLFTEHPSIKTEELNINFIFSDMEAKHSQWNFLYSRLPYLLVYFREVVEFLLTRIETIDSAYTQEMKALIAANICVWWSELPEELATDELDKFAAANEQFIYQYFHELGHSEISAEMVIELANTFELKRAQ